MVTATPLQIGIKPVPETLVAYIHYLGQPEDISAHLARLHAQVSPYISGEAIVLFDHTADENPQAGRNILVCYPVAQPVESGEVHSQHLPASEVAYVITKAVEDHAWGPAGWWKNLGQFLRDRQLAPDEDPLREIHRFDEHGHPVFELQAVLQFPRWLESFSSGLERYAGQAQHQQVMAGSADISAGSPIEQRLAWVQGAMQRLDAGVDDPRVRCRILNGCAHRFPAARIAKMRAIYQQSGDLDGLLDLMRADRSVDGASWYGDFTRQGNILYITKDPAYPQAFKEAQNETERRAAACFCAIGRAAIRAGESISPTFCNCGGGWFVQLWEGILQQPVRVDVLESALLGADHCRFAIHLPE